MRRQYRLVRVLLALLLPSAGLYAQEVQLHQEKKEAAKPFINRWAFKTNILEWCLTVPNVGFEFDLSSSDYNRSTIGLSAKYNWNTYHRHVPVFVFDMLDVRPEYRYYFRKLGKGSQEGDKKLRNVKYIGAYADYAQYSFKLRTGMQGQTVGAGVSFGWMLPVFQFRKGALDLDLGFSAGIQVTEYDAFTRDVPNNCYVKLTNGSKAWHLTKFPVVSELRVALAWRSESVRHKFIKTDPMLKTISLAESDVEMYFAGIRTSFDEGLSDEMRKSYASDPSAYKTAFVDYVEKTAETADEYVKTGYVLSKSAYVSVKKKIKSMKRDSIREFDRSMKAEAKKARASKTRSKKERSTKTKSKNK